MSCPFPSVIVLLRPKMNCTVRFGKQFSESSPCLPGQQGTGQQGWYASGTLRKQFTKPTVQFILGRSKWMPPKGMRLRSQHPTIKSGLGAKRRSAAMLVGVACLSSFCQLLNATCNVANVFSFIFQDWVQQSPNGEA